MTSAKVVLIGIDAAIPTLVQKYFRMGKLPNMERLRKKERGQNAYLFSLLILQVIGTALQLEHIRKRMVLLI